MVIKRGAPRVPKKAVISDPNTRGRAVRLSHELGFREKSTSHRSWATTLIINTSHSYVSPTKHSSSMDTVQKPIIFIEANKLAYFSNEDVNALQKSITEMAACRGIFNSWAAELVE